MWFHVLFGFAFSLIPTLIAGRFVLKYAMYLAKLGRNRFQVALVTFTLLALLSFGISVIFGMIYVAILNPEYRPWLHRGGLIGVLICWGIIWLWQCAKIARYQASYFIEYIYPRPTVIFGVPSLIVAFAVLVFWKSGLGQMAAGYAATRARQPAFCRFVHDQDACQEQFYSDAAVASRKLDSKICRSLSGRHMIQCLVRYHSTHPDPSSCKVMREMEGEDSPAYYWCLGYLPKTHETIDACRRAESSFRWTNLFYGQCIDDQNINQKVESGKNVLMQFLVFKEATRDATTIGKTGIRYKLPIQTDLKSLLSKGPDLEKGDKEGRTVLFYVRDVKDLEALLDLSPRVNHQDQASLTAPMYWMTLPHPTDFGPLIERVVKKGYDVNVGDKKSRTLLIHFLLSLKAESESERNSQENKEFIETLLRLGSNPYLRDKNKKRGVDYAKDLGLVDALESMHKFRTYQNP